MMNDAIYTEQELKDGFYKAQKKGLISISESHLKMTPLGSQIIEKLRTMRGGRYSIVDNLFKILTSKKIVFGEIDEKDIDPCLFINPIAIQEAYLKYAEMLKR